MDFELDKMVSQIQEEIFSQAEKEYGKTFLQIWSNPNHLEIMDNCSVSSQLSGTCGDSMTFYLNIDQDIIQKATFTTTGCGPSIVCASIACELATRKNLEEAAALEAEDILAQLEKMPEDKKHCATLAAQTLRETIRKFWQKNNS